MRNGETKELKFSTHGHELRWGNNGGRGYRAEGNKGEKNGTTVIAIINKIFSKIKISKIKTNQ